MFYDVNENSCCECCPNTTIFTTVSDVRNNSNWFSEFMIPKDEEVHQGDAFICIEICSMSQI